MVEEGDYVTSMDDLVVATKPLIARACPFRVKLEKGKSYLYCTCGHSESQPFCDGSHRSLNNGYKPLLVEITKQQTSFLWCGCKRNQMKAGALCDGNHTNISDW
jgi:CDGSH iron-sulfur domain-containing protein 3